MRGSPRPGDDVFIDIRDVGKVYEADEDPVEALQGVSLQVRRGESTAFVTISGLTDKG